MPTIASIRACSAWLLSFGLVLFWCSNASAVPSSWSIAQLHHTAWTPREGAPTNIEALAQTKDGFLWLGTSSGLFRFDGMHFERFRAPPGVGPVPTSVLSLLASRDGGLWIGYAFGGISFLKDGKLRHYSLKDGLGRAGVSSLAQDDTGSIWAGTGRGLERFDDSRWTDMTSTLLRLPRARVAWLSIDGHGTLWVSAEGRLYYRPKDRIDSTAILLTDNPDNASSTTFSPAGAASGTEKTLEGESSYRFVTNDTLIDSSAARARWIRQSGSGTVQVYGGLIDRSGSYWIVLSHSSSAVCRIRMLAQPGAAMADPMPVVEVFGQKEGLSSRLAKAVIQDFEGDIWVAGAGGLDRFREPSLVPVNLPTSAEVEMGSAANGGVWLASTTSTDYNPLLLTEDGISARRFRNPRLLQCMSGSSDGTAWGAAGRDLWRSAGDRWVRVSTHLPQGPLGTNACQAILSSGDGSLWISYRQLGVFHLEHEVWQPVDVPEASSREPAVVLASNPNGQIWMGLVDNRVAVVDGKSVRILTSAEGLDTGTVLAIDAHRSHIWVGGERGLARFDGERFRPVALSDGRAGFSVSGIDELVNGDLWLNTTDGAMQIAAHEIKNLTLDPAYRARYRLFDSLEGMPGSAAGLAGLPTLIEGTDGRLWFATSNGVVWINPTSLAPHSVRAPKVFIEEIASKGRHYPPAAKVTLPMWTSDLQINYTAPSLALPERVGFRYRLEGIDRDWHLAGGRRAAFYTNVPPGTHLFSVAASTVDGIWSDNSTQATIFIPAAFQQTRAFIALCLLGCAAAIFAMFKLRMRQVKRRVRERFELRVAERTRLARNLHDTLLQTIQASKLAAEGALEHSDMSEATRVSVSRLSSWLERAEHEGRAALNTLRSRDMSSFFSTQPDSDDTPIWNIEPRCTCATRRPKTTSDLLRAIDAAGRSLVLDDSAVFSIAQQGIHTPVDEKVYTDVVLIVTEALQNAFRHACARKIEVRLDSSRWRLLVQVRDDGTGFEAGPAVEGVNLGHWGLEGMRERAQRLRADLRIISKPGAGTTVELRIRHLVTRIRGVRLAEGL